MPLFEKVLSASDAGRIGRLVLPKACAEVSSSICSFLYLDSLDSITGSKGQLIVILCSAPAINHLITFQAYFPPISQPEGLPLRIQDVKGKEWVFQFRFWPNNNSRMYVLEGVTPCIQSMQLQAGDTGIF